MRLALPSRANPFVRDARAGMSRTRGQLRRNERCPIHRGDLVRVRPSGDFGERVADDRAPHTPGADPCIGALCVEVLGKPARG